MVEENINSNYRKKVIIFWIITILLIIAIITLLVLTNIQRKQQEQQIYSDLLHAIQSEDLEKMYQLYQSDVVLNYPMAVDNYEKYFLGNSNHNILQKGKYFINETQTIFVDNQTLVVKSGNNQSTIFSKPVSFINVWNQAIYFVEDDSHFCYKYENGKAVRFLAEYQVGQILIDNGIMYFVNLNSESALHMIDLETQEQRKIFDFPTTAFAIVGNNIMISSRSGDFSIHNKITRQEIASLKNVLTFDIDGLLYFHDGKNLVSSTANLEKAERIMEFSGRFVSKIGDDYVFEKDKKLLLKTKDGAYIIAQNQYCLSALLVEESIMVYSIDLSKYESPRLLNQYEYQDIVDIKNKES